MSWSALLRLGVTLRPYDNPPPSGGTPSPFDATLSSTLSTLGLELDKLAARQIVLQVGYREQDLRVDGLPRANSKMLHDAVALSFVSRWGPLRYETNEFVRRGYYVRHDGGAWESNLRAIALGMEALRKVDRYGVSKRGEQYTGYRQLAPSNDPADSLTTAAGAVEAIHTIVGDLYDVSDIEGAFRAEAIREALKRTHPDRGGDSGQFRRTMRAKELLGE